MSNISKAFWLKSGATAIAIVSSGALVAAGFESSLDYGRINASIASAIDPVVRDSAIVESAVVTIDGSVTDFDKDTYKIDKALVLKKAPWSSNPVTANLSLKATMKRNDNPEKGKIESKLDMSMKTDTLALVKFMQLKKVKRCQERTETGVKGIFQKHECGLAADVLKANSLAEIAALIKGHVKSEREELESFAAQTQPSLESVESALLREEGAKILDKARRKLHYLESVKVEKRGEGFSVSADHARSRHPGCKIKHLEMVLDPESSSVKIDATTRLATMKYDAFKPEMVQMFKGLEEGREFAVEHVASHVRYGERLISSMVKMAASMGQQAGQETTGHEGHEGQGGQEPEGQMPLQLIDLVNVAQPQALQY
jgi:hypothetical protein